MNTAILIAALVLIQLSCREVTKSTRLSVLATSWTMLALMVYSAVRPQVFSFLGFALFYWALRSLRLGARRQLWILPPAMLLWVNLHGAFVLGLGLVGLFLFMEIFWRSSSFNLRHLTIIFLTCGLITLVNPVGFDVYRYVGEVLSDPGSPQLVSEWQTPKLNDLDGFLAFYLPFFAALLVLLRTNRPRPDEVVVFILFSPSDYRA